MLGAKMFLVLIYLTALRLTSISSQIQSKKPACHLEIIKTFEDYEYMKEGDIMIAGVLTVNTLILSFEYPMGLYDAMLCVGALAKNYRQFVDFLFAIEQINNNSDQLLNLTLGYHIYDSCGDARKAVRSVFQILSGINEPVPNYSCVDKRNIAGFIGDLSSETTVPIAQVLNVYGYAQISYGATDPLLSDRVAFPYFFRMVQSDHGHYLALSKLLKYFEWTWIGIIQFNDNSGEKQLQLLTNYLTMEGICVEFKIKLSNYIKDTPMYKMHKEIIQKSSTSVIILCGTASVTFVETFRNLTDVFRKKTLIISSTVTANHNLMDYYLEIFHCSLGFVQESVYSLDSPKMRSFLQSFHPLRYPEDKLLEHIWMQYHFCLSEDASKNDLYENVYKITLHNSTGQDNLTDILSTDSTMHFPLVHFAVNIIAGAVHKMHDSLTELISENKTTGHYYKHKLHLYLKNLRYKTLRNKTKIFNENGELISEYLIYNYIMDSGTHIVVNYLGVFNPWEMSDQKLEIISSDIRWKTNDSKIPRAQCSDKCLPGFRKAPRPGVQSCCYDCVPCPAGDISTTTDSERCARCPDKEWPNENKDQCITKTEEFLTFANDMMSVFFSTISVLIFLVTLLILGVFITYRDSPIVRANNRTQLLLLVSIKLSFLSVFLFLGRPVDITCMLRNITFGITFSIAVSSLLAKTIMVCVAFKATKPGSTWRKWVGAKLSYSVVLFCSSIQIIICMTWLAISPPFQELDLHTYPGTIIIQCNEGSAIGFYSVIGYMGLSYWLLSVIGYMGLLAAVSFVLAFLARTLPDSFNEAKYITFSMLLFCSVWITMIPAYLSTKGKNTVCVEIFAILTSSAGLLACIFLPKCYIILFTPEMNTKSHLLGNRIGSVILH
ncbi:pheromone receptor-like L homeolog precursor [Xenopus laevis]|uniref:Pheromone receptor-like L homeolog precursor n=1 Tax=Xenopus laevis TaxID=8355 RepID=Q767K3_XENLA|nr:pheromone receptor-like L homeolog precursor [Xenopus laevis]BAD13712.1 putative pheromone receptor [Xenopus laevis]